MRQLRLPRSHGMNHRDRSGDKSPRSYARNRRDHLARHRRLDDPILTRRAHAPLAAHRALTQVREHVEGLLPRLVGPRRVRVARGVRAPWGCIWRVAVCSWGLAGLWSTRFPSFPSLWRETWESWWWGRRMSGAAGRWVGGHAPGGPGCVLAPVARLRHAEERVVRGRCGCHRACKRSFFWKRQSRSSRLHPIRTCYTTLTPDTS